MAAYNGVNNGVNNLERKLEKKANDRHQRMFEQKYFEEQFEEQQYNIEGLREKIRQLELELKQLQGQLTSTNNEHPNMPQTNGGKTRKHRRSIKRRNRKH